MDNTYIIALLKCQGIGNSKLLDYITKQKFNIENIKKNINKLISIDDYNNFDKYLDIADKEIKTNLKKGIQLITILDEEYPSKLFTITDPILYLYYRGDIKLITKPSIAVIGTRSPKDNTKVDTYNLVYDLVKEDYVIVSGLALGVDSIAHKSCVDNKGKTIAVLPTGIDNIQPSSNRTLAEDIIKNNGCLVSEYSVGTPLNKFNYAKRDRIQSALSNVIITPEAGESSGTMIAINKSIKESKPVFQFITNDNKLIKNILDIKEKAYLNKIRDSILDDLKRQKIKEKNIKEKTMESEQITLF